MNEFDNPDNISIHHHNTRIRVQIDNKITMIDERDQQPVFREVEKHYYNAKYRIKMVVDKLNE